MATVLKPPAQVERKVILDNISWGTYERLLAEHGETSGTRFTYDRGTLEIMITSLKHEKLNRRLAELFTVIADELGIDFEGAGSTTFRRRDLARGFEPDSCFYIRDAELIRRKDAIDLEQDPSPELVIEIDISSSSLPRLSVFAATGVTEVWRYNGAHTQIFRLAGGDYVEVEESVALPGVTGRILGHFIEVSELAQRSAWLREVREWAQARIQLRRDC